MHTPKLNSLKVIPEAPSHAIKPSEHRENQGRHPGQHPPSKTQKLRLRRSQLITLHDVLPQGTGSQINVVA